MKRRYKSYKTYRAEGEESILVKVGVGLGFLLLLAIAGVVVAKPSSAKRRCTADS